MDIAIPIKVGLLAYLYRTQEISPHTPLKRC